MVAAFARRFFDLRQSRPSRMFDSAHWLQGSPVPVIGVESVKNEIEVTKEESL